MWIEGRRRGGAKALSKHLQKIENEAVFIRQLEGFSLSSLTGENLEKALKQMECIGYGKGDRRNLYHAIIAPAYGETLNFSQQKVMVDYYAKHMGFKNHQRVVVEHWKKGKQHFHLVFNIIDPVTGKTHELKWTKLREWKIARGLEEIFKHNTPTPKGKSARTWEMQRSKRSCVDPCKMREDVTAIFNASDTAQEFVAALNKAGYVLTRGKRGQLVLVDRAGDTHGLMRRIEGKRIADLREKFPGIEKMQLPIHADVVSARKGKK
ncbi:MAG: relaxase/mobilization nuclease domain-containing protein, partial [Alphaproteobacteria bacterium]|nr:relaxase/mobilization nuclease domain-containing protein [Alphaproteobacteria bacterium]